MVDAPAPVGVQGLPQRAGRGIRIAQRLARLRVEHHRNHRMGHVAPHPLDHRHPARRHRAGGYVLARVLHGHAAHVRRQLRRAQLPGFGHRRDACLHLVPDQPLELRCGRARARRPLLHRARLPALHGNHLRRCVPLQARRRHRRRLRGAAAAGRQALPRRHLADAPIGRGVSSCS